MRACLLQARELLVSGAPFYLRRRLPDDHRYGHGQLEDYNAWRLSCDYTGEAGALNVFWHQHEVVDFLGETLGVSQARLTVLRVAHENIHDGNLVRNSDAVFWGRLPLVRTNPPMKCGIMQPTYLPWSGYFNLISSVDIFVFLDDIQFNRRSWQTCNRVLLRGEEYMLSVSTK